MPSENHHHHHGHWLAGQCDCPVSRAHNETGLSLSPRTTTILLHLQPAKYASSAIHLLNIYRSIYHILIFWSSLHQPSSQTRSVMVEIEEVSLESLCNCVSEQLAEFNLSSPASSATHNICCHILEFVFC